jgi:hypothetical protein
MKLFKKNQEDVFARLDKLMSEMANTETYVEYLREREGM